MNKIAKRLILFALVAAVSVFILLNRILNKPSNLVKLVPSSATAVVHLDTRALAKEIYRHGGFSVNDLADIKDSFPYFGEVDDPRMVGIDLFTELFLFTDQENDQTYQAILFNLINEGNFKHFCEGNSQLTKVKLTKNGTCYMSHRDSFYLWFHEKEAGILVGIKDESTASSIVRKWQKKEANSSISSLIKEEGHFHFWQSQSNPWFFSFLKGQANVIASFEQGQFSYQINAQQWDQSLAKDHYLLSGNHQIEVNNQTHMVKGSLKTQPTESNAFGFMLNLYRTNGK